MLLTLALALGSLSLLACVADPGPPQPPTPTIVTPTPTPPTTTPSKPADLCPVSWRVDRGIPPARTSWTDSDGHAAPVAASRAADGEITTFIEDEVLVTAKSRAELDTFLVTYGGNVVRGAGATYTVRLDPMAFVLDQTEADATKLHMCGEIAFSSDVARHLLGIIVHERAAGRSVSIDAI
jgi:hypothetical protein